MEVRIARRCGCVIKNGLEAVTRTEDREAARLKAEEIVALLEKNSCGAHCFFVRESEMSVIVDSRFNEKLISL